uniref:Uncharacterized protein n=1 Tax=Timema bartmani TaxID=61472 RepID=A0A7R9F7R7_9NEOP|nr:unnamed protein product [Timema bartmani]
MWAAIASSLLFILKASDALSTHPILLVVSFDGFRYNYFNKGVTPTMDSLKPEGSRAEYMNNVFPTKTFPNHHSIATGLYPESHGVLGNSVYDPVKKRVLGYSADLFKNSEVTPIWVTSLYYWTVVKKPVFTTYNVQAIGETLNQKASNGRHSGVMMWPGGEFEYKQTLPTFRQPLDLNTAWEIRVDTVIGWILHRSTPANLVMLYFEEPDRRAHAFGPESPNFRGNVPASVRRKGEKPFRTKTPERDLNPDLPVTGNPDQQESDAYLRQKLSANNLLGKVNVVQLSDHGMESVTFPRIINLTDFVDKTLFQEVDTSPVLQIFPKIGTVTYISKENTVYQTLKTSSKNRHYKIYRKAELPERWHYKNNPRTPPLLAVADEGYGFHDMYAAEQYFTREWHITMSPKMVFGLHGYDNSEPNMRPFFLSWGPRIKKNYVISPFNTIDLYSLFSKILELTPPKTNGTGIYVEALLKTKT